MKQGWKTYRLGDIAKFQTGKLNSNAAVENGKYPFFTCSPNTLAIDNYAFDKEAILLAGNNAEGNFSIKYYKGKFNAYQRTYIIETYNDICDIKFLFYALKLCLQQFKLMSQGTSTKFLTAVILNNFEISLPPLEEQRRIAGILGAIDDKIENNRRINTNLELQAQALYKQWFVDFDFPNEEGKPYKSSGGKMVNSELGPIPDGWRVQTFGDLIKPQKGKNITRAQVTMGSVPVVAGGLMPSCYHNTSNTHCPVVTISASGANAGYVKMYYMPIWAADCSYIDDTISKYVHFAYVFLTYNQTSIYHKQQGCAQPHIYPSHLMELQFICPTLDILDKFESCSKKIYRPIGANIQENETLATLRDTLLPKLMNNEIKL